MNRLQKNRITQNNLTRWYTVTLFNTTFFMRIKNHRNLTIHFFESSWNINIGRVKQIGAITRIRSQSAYSEKFFRLNFKPIKELLVCMKR